MYDVLIPELNVPFMFRSRAIAIPPDLRPSWRAGLVLLILRNCCRDGRSSFARLHVLNWASRTRENQVALLGLLNHESKPENVVVRIEPALNRAVDLASGARLVDIVGGDRVELTDKGTIAATRIEASQNIFEIERKYLTQLGRSVTESVVDRLFSSYKGV